MSTSDIAAVPAVPVFGEAKAIALVGAVQFVNVLDFMMVMPLGPDLASALAIDPSNIGLIGGAYTAAAAVAGVLGAFVLDRFDRRTALVASLIGVACGTYAGAFAVDLPTLLAARVLAGLFGGPATAVGVAIIADVVPPERRGTAMGKVMGAFAVASVLGVPAGLEAARLFDFRAPFLGVGTLALVAALAAHTILPSMRGHLAGQSTRTAVAPHFGLAPFVSIASWAIMMMGHFALIPNLSTYLQYNLHYPRERLGLLYMAGGAAAFFAMRATGRLVDRFGSSRLVVIGTVSYCAMCLALFFTPLLATLPALGFAGFMTANSMRFVPLQSLSSRVPTLDQRARFLSTQSAVQHLASAIGAIASAHFLVSAPDHRLVGIDRVVWFAVGLALVVPPLTFFVERHVRAREDAQRR